MDSSTSRGVYGTIRVDSRVFRGVDVEFDILNEVHVHSTEMFCNLAHYVVILFLRSMMEIFL